MAKLISRTSMRDINDDPVTDIVPERLSRHDPVISPVDAEYRGYTKKGNLDPGMKDHIDMINQIAGQIESGLVSRDGVENLARLNPKVSPILKAAYSSYLSKQTQEQQVQGIVGRYISPGTGGEGDYATPPTDPREDPKGLVRELASNPSLRDVAKEYSDLYGLGKTAAAQGRGAYRIPVQTPAGIFSFNARAEGEDDVGNYVTDKYGRPVIGSASSPDLQGRLKASEEYGKVVGKESADVGRSIDASTSIAEAMSMLDKGIYAGTYGEAKKFAAKALPGADKTIASNTEQFISHIGNVVIPRLKDFGGNDTVEEMKYLKLVQGGEISMEPETLRRILVSSDRKIKAKQIRMQKQAGTVGLGGKVEAITKPDSAPEQPKAGTLTNEQRDALKKRYGL